MSTAEAQTPSPPHAAFASRLKSARLRSGKSQERIALEVGTSRRHWIRWEGGWHLPSQPFIARIAAATGQPVEFLNGTPDAAAEKTGDPDDEDEESDLVAALRMEIRRLVREENAALSEAGVSPDISGLSGAPASLSAAAAETPQRRWRSL